MQWWDKIVKQAELKLQQPLLFFKYSRSKVFVVTTLKPDNTRYNYVSWLDCYIMVADEWLEQEKVEWTGGEF